jgi:hypothetical protein
MHAATEVVQVSQPAVKQVGSEHSVVATSILHALLLAVNGK